jgi:hypothetical protein
MDSDPELIDMMQQETAKVKLYEENIAKVRENITANYLKAREERLAAENEKLFWAFVAGFMSSSYPWNGDNIFNDDEYPPLETLKAEFEISLESGAFTAEHFDYLVPEDEDNSD